MGNPFAGRVGMSGPANDIRPVTPDDGVDLPEIGVALYVTVGGAVAFVTESGAARTVTLLDGAILPVGVRRVKATGTTATGIHVFTVA